MFLFVWVFFKSAKNPPPNLDAFQRTVIPFRDPVDADSKDKSLAPTQISGLFRKQKQNRFSSLEICTPLKKRTSWQKRAINPSEGNGAPTTQPGTGNGGRARPFQGTAGALRALSLTQRSPPGGSSSPAGRRGARGQASELGLPGPGARRNGERAFQSGPGYGNGSGASSLASPPRRPHPTSQPFTWQKLRQ